MKLAKKLSIAAAGVALGFASVSVPSSAQAAQLFNFSYYFYEVNNPVISARGTLTTTDLDPVTNTYKITGITGTRIVGNVQKNILGLLQPRSYYGNDNLLSADFPFLSPYGFSFTVDGGDFVNVYYDDFFNNYWESSTADDVNAGPSFNVTNVTNNQPVPEPTTIAGSLAIGSGLVISRLKKRKLEQAS